MTRVVLDTNIVVSALLVPAGRKRLFIAGTSGKHRSLYPRARRVRRGFAPTALRAAATAYRSGTGIHPQGRESRRANPSPCHFHLICSQESDNRFLECAKAAAANYIVTGNTRHFPQRHKETKIVSGRQLLDILAESENDP